MMRLHTRAARGGRGRGKGGGRAGQRIPEGSPGWAGEAAWLPHGHCSFRERDAAIPRPCPSGGASSPRLCAPPLRDRFAPFKGPAVCGSDRRASTGQELRASSLPRGSARTSSLPAPPAASPCPQGLAGSPGTSPQDRGRDGEGTSGAPLSGQPGGASSSGATGGARQGWWDRPRHRRPLPAPPPPAGRRLPWRRINSIPRDRAPREPRARRGPHRLPRGTPSRPLPRRQRGRPRAATSAPTGFPAPAAPARPTGHRPRAPAPGPCAQTRRGRRVRCPPPPPRPPCRQSCTRLS